MKFITTSLVSFLALYASTASAVNYSFDCGDFGSGSFEIDKGSMSVDIKLQNLDGVGLSVDDNLNYHLHTTWKNAVASSTSVCGPDATGGHYDPTYKCGGASEAINLPQCNNADYSDCNGDNPEKCERGDLSSKYGALLVKDDFTAEASVTGDRQGAKIQDFQLDNPTRDPKVWSSIVFHNGSPRVLCCKIVEA